uniref:Phosphofurin acidic cluster sorting protein 1/2 N-terminal C2 domain-containing protein n=1 Tax=Anopheles atroparvus TaxID=41427 RepID=A0A182IT72_ANOAO
MTDKVTKFERMAMSKPVPMKLFAAWEVDRTPSNCIPRRAARSLTRQDAALFLSLFPGTWAFLRARRLSAIVVASGDRSSVPRHVLVRFGTNWCFISGEIQPPFGCPPPGNNMGQL